MNLPPDVEFREDLHLLLWKPRGILNEQVFNKILAFLCDVEARSDANELHFIDTTKLRAVELNFHYVFHISLYRRLSRSGRPKVKSACLALDEGFAHYFKLHAILTARSTIQVELFEKREAAARWLGVAVEVLEPA